MIEGGAAALAWGVLGAGLAWVGFAYAGYPALLWLLARVAPRPVRAADCAPPLSVVIAVHDGAAELERKLGDLLACRYPGERQVVVASDGSTDDTEAVARRFAGRGVELVALPERRGKEAAQAAALARCRGEVLVFTDVSARLEPEALERLVRPFADPWVGAVSSEDRVEGSGGEGAYVRFEMALRRLESRAGSLVGLSGSLFACRRALAEPWPADLASDFRTALEAGRRGLRAVCAPDARARFGTADDPGAEWERKVRTVRRGLAVLSAYPDLLHPARGRVALCLWGHKVARFTSPFALGAVLVASAALASASPVAGGIAALGVAGCAAGGAALTWPAVARWRPARLAGFFLLVNASIVAAWAHHLSGRRAVTWTPTRRADAPSEDPGR